MANSTSATTTNITTPLYYTESPEQQQTDFWIGLGLAVGSSFFIGTSFILQKLGLRASAAKQGVGAGEGGHKYLLQWKWWLGMLLMALGEGCNFAAFIFAPATLITPLGALSVIFSAVLASYFLDEGLNLLGKLGCVLCVLGSTTVVLHSPKSAEIQNMHELLEKLKEPVFILAAALAIIFLAPKYGRSNVVVYVFICSTLGALTVMGCKGLGVALKETFAGRNEFTNWLTYVMIGVAGVNIVFQINFLNKALDNFNTAVVTPTYYVMFTSCVTIIYLLIVYLFYFIIVSNTVTPVFTTKMATNTTMSTPLTTTPMLPINTTENISTTTLWTHMPREEALREFWIGLALAITSACFTGSSFILKKKGLLNASQKGSRAGDGGFAYLKQFLWWMGMILMIVGEIMNFLAYLFAPATLVTPLGALSVITSAMMASYFLKEKLNLLGKLGCMLCVLGSTLIVVHSPVEQEIQTMEDLLDRLLEPGIIILSVALIAIALVSVIFLAPKYGQKNVLVYVTVCSTLGSFTVMGAKGFGVAIKETINGRNEFTNFLTYVMAGIVIACSLVELVYLNKSLDTFNTAIVTPTYYVLFTSCAVMFSLVMFKEFGTMSTEDIIGAIIGFMVICCGIFLLNAFKNMDVSLRNLPKAHKRTTSHSSQNGDVMTSVSHDDHHLLEDNENHSHDEENPLDDRSIVFADDPKLYDHEPKTYQDDIKLTTDSNSNISNSNLNTSLVLDD
ncbi:magnesium transporter NIPA3-like [Ruditapes philippinarum]|uniref:magnesium transporter NIPA3-like n=1 Tax=Ruditapes philippinarum TaxID=129788 RepID=UPI00295B8A9C|nr:magnesium transporter NIPA3-like [Ruditapes philippinarum]